MLAKYRSGEAMQPATQLQMCNPQFPFSKKRYLSQKCVENTISDLGLELWPGQVQKITQLYEQLAVRHGVMLVGPSGGGKTTVRTVLQKALVAMYTNLLATNREEVSAAFLFSDFFTDKN